MKILFQNSLNPSLVDGNFMLVPCRNNDIRHKRGSLNALFGRAGVPERDFRHVASLVEDFVVQA